MACEGLPYLVLRKAKVKTSEDTMNLDGGLLLPSVWNPILNSP